MKEYRTGTTLQIRATISDLSGALFDPATVTFVYRRPQDTATQTLAMTRESLGVYTVLLSLTQEGIWRYEVRADGGLSAAAAGSFYVHPALS